MEIFAIIVFILGYLGIAFEHPLKIDKAAFALITGVLCWTVYVFTGLSDADTIHNSLSHHLSEISEILFFLIGAMTIVELVDVHGGFKIITDKITTKNTKKLLWIIGILSFFMSAALDNLTTSIVMISLLRKLIKDQKLRWFFAGIVIIACNAGGAWSPIGDVTTTMLWIKGQTPSTINLIVDLILPSLVSLIVPLAVLSFVLKGEVERPDKLDGEHHHHHQPTTAGERWSVFLLGLSALLFVPVFKVITHLPPFMGMMLGLGVMWGFTELLHHKKSLESKQGFSVTAVLRKIDTASVLFFLGILLAVSALQELGFLRTLAQFLDEKLNNIYAINMAIGLLSALVDNVPLVAAAQGMYEISTVADSPFAADGTFWLFLAYCAGTGGSSLIIGSAAGVAVMGLEKISFGWYLKTITPWAILGYLAGAIFYIFLH